MRKFTPFESMSYTRRLLHQMERFGVRGGQAALAKRAPGDSRGVPLSLLSDPLSHCKYVTYSRTMRD
jgi:hypothetical protein